MKLNIKLKEIKEEEKTLVFYRDVETYIHGEWAKDVVDNIENACLYTLKFNAKTPDGKFREALTVKNGLQKPKGALKEMEILKVADHSNGLGKLLKVRVYGICKVKDIAGYETGKYNANIEPNGWGFNILSKPVKVEVKPIEDTTVVVEF